MDFLNYINVPGCLGPSGWDWVSCIIGLLFGFFFGGLCNEIFPLFRRHH